EYPQEKDEISMSEQEIESGIHSSCPKITFLDHSAFSSLEWLNGAVDGLGTVLLVVQPVMNGSLPEGL
ncbi:MAG TPA: hypothetical protein VKZ59_11330, partial [Acidobacteriota bacterium]|nr:hypothetical protein [Acidobacteriota bacterium]